jgi:protein-tyrosine phosphatase
MKYVVAFGFLAACLFGIAIHQGGPCWLALWPGTSSLLLAAAYAGLGPGVFGKRNDGTMAWWAVVLMLPYLLMTWGLWHVLRLVEREECCQLVAPGIWLGRRALAHELPENIDLIVDLTAEFFEVRGIIEGRTYLCLPTLDASVPDDAAFKELIEKVVAWPGSAYVHCASGHGRSATLVAVVLIRKGLAKDTDDAVRRIKAVRPSIGLVKQQRLLVDRSSRKSTSTARGSDHQDHCS